ncbi:MAG: heme/copper-type cytochrome/quinol oxidase subunit 3 [Pseudoalteromonas tetraodonis]|jgi:heme/copper-type cytochrome/quinol oxidase subunit 3
MEIPYEVKPRPDTGLWNAKIGIWLFLASEVMLFGGLFSSYIFLRLGSGADPNYHWPHHLLNVNLGLLNTIVLIASSVFIVFAWVKLKLRDWKGFQFWMRLVLLCALGFLMIKSYEYYTKFIHYGAKLSDNTIIEGHKHHHNGETVPLDSIAYDEINQINLNLEVTDYRINDIAYGASRGDLYFRLVANAEGKTLIDNELVDTATFFESAYNGLFAGKGYQLEADEAAAIADAHKVLKENLSGNFAATKSKIKEIRVSVDAHRKAQRAPLERARKIEYAKFREINPGRVSGDLEKEAQDLARPIRWFPRLGLKSLTLEPVGKDGSEVKPFSIATKRSKLRSFSETSTTLGDMTTVSGKLSPEKRFLIMDVDRIDVRSTTVPENSMIWQYLDPHQKEYFLKHRDAEIAKAKDHGHEPKIADSLRVRPEKHDGHYPKVAIPFDQITLYSNFTPKWNTYLAVYFVLTGLHGLHVLIGALVLSYFLFFGKKMFDEDPEHLTNRVEVGGLFWHFVDLVWIFLFPVLYLM